MYSDRLQPDPMDAQSMKVGSTGSQPPGQGRVTSRWSWLHLAEGSALGRGGISSQPLMQLGNETFDQKGNFQDTSNIHYSRELSSFVSWRANTSLKFFSNSASSLNPIRPKSLNWNSLFILFLSVMLSFFWSVGYLIQPLWFSLSISFISLLSLATGRIYFAQSTE